MWRSIRPAPKAVGRRAPRKAGQSQVGTKVDLNGEIRRAQELGQSIENLVVRAGQLTINTKASPLLIGFWTLICDYQKGLLHLLSWQMYGAAFALWRPIVEATVRSHLALILPNEDIEKLWKDDYRVNFKTVPAQIDEAFGLGQVFQNFLLARVRESLHSYPHSGIVPLRRRFEGTDVAANYPDAEIFALINTTASGVFMVTSLVTKHFGFDKEWQEAQMLYGRWARQKQGEALPPEGF
jgi:hypothetical protein